jgi:hypothetical protein
MHLLAGKMRHLLAHADFGLLKRQHAKLLQNMLAMVEAGDLVVARPLDRSQVVALLYVRLVGQQEAVCWEEAPGGLEVANLQHEATLAVRRQQRIQKLGSPIGQGEEELPLRLIEDRGLVEGAALGRVE